MKLMSFNKPELTTFIRALTKSILRDFNNKFLMDLQHNFGQQITPRFQTGRTGPVDMIKRGLGNTAGALAMTVPWLT